ncbi:MAG: M50 family metallopeptidase [Candidatus Yanofskybacteria bacterium]|nr:M50 family metallopeptidase [Candidatus Yanofskybacteria bacterium]
MVIPIGAAIVSLLVLVILHELGHFWTARRFGIKVEEFGIGLPPRLFGKKIGETIYSLNLLPLGAFVRMEGEEGESKSPTSFSAKPVWQRLLVVAGGVIVFWMIAAALLGVLAATSGIQAQVPDEEPISNPWVQIQGIAQDSPAQEAGIMLGDQIIALAAGEAIVREVTTVSAVQEFAEAYAGQEVEITLLRGNEEARVSLIPRVDPPAGQGAMGIALSRIGTIQYAWYEAPLQGVLMTLEMTGRIVGFFGVLIADLVTGREVEIGTDDVRGPIGIISMMQEAFSGNLPQFFMFVALISIHLAIFNVLPIPALDGGRMFFLLIEAVRRKPLPQAWEQRMIVVSMLLLISLIVLISIQDISRVL